MTGHLNKVNKINREKLDWLFTQKIEVKLEMLRNHIDMCRIMINEILETEVRMLSGEWYSHNKPNEGRYYRWGYNPGSVRIGSEKVPIEIPRVINKEVKKDIQLENYKLLKNIPEPTEEVIDKIILGLSQRDYERVSKESMDSFGLSQSSVSRMYIEATAKALEEFESRDISQQDIIALIIDGKSLLKHGIIICMGVTIKGEKMVLGFIQSTTENHRAIKQLLKQLIKRGLNFYKGLLIVSDGSKGIKKAISEVFGKYYVHQRCMWHKRENVISYLSENEQEIYRKKLQKAYRETDYKTAKSMLLKIRDELKEINIHAARSLEEGLEETLTLHKLGLIEKLGASLGTTNCIESLNSQLGRYMRKVTRWRNSNQILRWSAAAILESERRMKKIRNYKSLITLREKIMKELKIKIRNSYKIAV
jgi:transposase-like protein